MRTGWTSGRSCSIAPLLPSRPRSVRSADCDADDYAVFAGRGAYGFLARFIRTALGAVVGAIAASYFEPHLVVFGSSVLILGLLCAVLRAEPAAYPFGGITLAIVMLVPHTGPDRQMVLYRFAEVSIGIAVAVVPSVV